MYIYISNAHLYELHQKNIVDAEQNEQSRCGAALRIIKYLAIKPNKNKHSYIAIYCNETRVYNIVYTYIQTYLHK